MIARRENKIKSRIGRGFIDGALTGENLAIGSIFRVFPYFIPLFFFSVLRIPTAARDMNY